MYDKNTLRLPSFVVPHTDLIEETACYFDVTGEHDFKGQRVISGTHAGLKITCSQRSFKMVGSWCKSFHGDNFKTLTRSDTQRFIEKISDELHLPLYKADITNFEFAQNFVMQNPTEVYLNHLGDLAHYKRLPQPDGLYYTNGRRQAIFYDKVKEQKNKGEPIPDLYRGRNVLRYEMRFKNRLEDEFKTNGVKASTLYNERFYIGVYDRWCEVYNSIRKLNDLVINFSSMKTKRELYLCSVAGMVAQHGGELNFIKQIAEAQSTGELTKKQAHDLRGAVKEACQSNFTTKQSEAIKELDKKIKDASRFYR